MANNKYQILSDDKISVFVEGRRVTLYRIQALRDIRVPYGVDPVKKGDLGGYIEKPSNLSQEGECWVGTNAKVCDSAVVSKNAFVYGTSTIIHENARVTENAFVGHGADIGGDAEIGRYVSVNGRMKIKTGRIIHQWMVDSFSK